MKVSKKMCMILLTALLPFTNAQAGESHGGDVFSIGGGLKVFDEIEHENPFNPSELPEYKEFILPQLTTLKSKLPRTGRLVEQALTRGIQPRWHFVTVKLKEINDEGPTNLNMVGFEKTQAAVNSGRVVQINQDIWSKLKPRSKAYLLVHEAVISAIGVTLLNSGSQIRSLAGLILHKDLKTFSAAEISDDIVGIVHNEKSKVHAAALLDSGAASTDIPKFEDASTLADGSTPTSCLENSDHCVFKDKENGIYWTKGFSEDQGVKTWEAANNYCSELKNWGGYSDWRMPYLNEIKMLSANQPKSILASYAHWGTLVGAIWSKDYFKDDRSRSYAYQLQFSQLKDYPNQSVGLNFRCVRSDLDRRWISKSTNKNSEALTPCNAYDDECAFQDTKTKLIWSAELRTSDLYTHNSAPWHCHKLSLAKRSGWRLPTIEEAKAVTQRGLYALLSRLKDRSEIDRTWTYTIPGNISYWVNIMNGEKDWNGYNADHKTTAICVQQGE